MHKLKKHTSFSKSFTLTFEICLISIFVTFITILRYILYYLPNVELVTFFLVIFILLFKNHFNWILVNSFCLIQVILFGYTDLCYFVIYNLYCLIVILSRKLLFSFQFLLAILIFLFGIFFGVIYSLNHLITYNFNFKIMFAYYLRGIIFDVIHGVANIILFSCLYYPIQKIMKNFALNNTNLFNYIYLQQIV